MPGSGAWRTLSIALDLNSGPYVSGLGRARAATGQFDSSLRGTTRVIPTLGMMLGTLGGGAILGVGTALALATSAASEFESQMSAVRAVSNASAADMGLLRDEALALGASTIYSATEVGGAMEGLVKAGLSVDQVLGGAADATVALAAAGGVELEEAATIGANALNTFGLEAAQLPGVADTLAGAANTSAIGISDLGMSLQQSGAAAALAGLSLEDTVTAIGLMGDAGIRGSDAGTSLKTMLMNLQPATAKQRTEMERLGLVTEDGASKFFDAQGEVKSLEDIAGLLQERLGGLTRAQQLASLEIIFGSDAIRAAAVLMSEGATGARDFAAAMGDMTAEEVAAMRLDNLSGDIEAFKGAIDTFLISSGTPLVEWLRDVVQFGTSGIEWLNNPPAGLTKWVSDLGSVLQISAQLIPAGGDHAGMLDSLSDRYGTLGDVAAGVVPILGDIWSTGEHVRDLAIDLARELRPAAEGLAEIGGGAAIAGLQGTATALEATTGFLADHHELVLATAGAYLGFRGAAVATAGLTKAWGGVTALRAGLAGFNTQLWVMQSAAAANGQSMGRLPVLMRAASVSARQAGSSFLASGAAMNVAAAAVAAGGVLMWQSWSKAKADARDSLDDLKPEDFDDNSIRSLEQYGSALNEAWGSATGAAEGQATFGNAVKGTVEALSPLESSVLNVYGNLEEASKAAEENARVVEALRVAYVGIYEELNGPLPEGRTLAMGDSWFDEMDRWVQKLDLDPYTMSVTEMAGAIEDAKAASATGAPAVDDLVHSFTVLGDETSTATDKLEAWQEAMDAIIGVQVGFEQAQIGFAESLYALTDAQREAYFAGEAWSTSLDRADPATLRTRSAVADLVDEAIGMAGAFYEAGGGIDGATWKLAEARNQIIAAGEAAGISEEDMIAYLEVLGLTPETLTTVIEAETDDGALTATDRALDAVSRTRTATTFAEARTGGAEGHLAHLARDRTANIAVDFDVRGQGVVIGGGVTLFNTGGYVGGSGPNVDSVPAMLTPREYVFQQPVVDDFERSPLGVGWLDAVNAGRITPADIMAMAHGQFARYNTGGYVDDAPRTLGLAGDWGAGSMTAWPLGRVGDEVLSKARGAATAWLDDHFAEAYSMAAPPGGGGANAAMAQAWIVQALSILGLPMTWLGPAMSRAYQESGYNPHAINLWDSNAAKGVPSKGLFQTIDPTFNAYKLPGLGNIWDPIHNAVAAFRYMIARYGSVFNLPSGGYNLGGLVEPAPGLSGLTLHGQPWDAPGALHAAPPGLNAFWNGTGRMETFREQSTSVSHLADAANRALNVTVKVENHTHVYVGNEKLGSYVDDRALGVAETTVDADHRRSARLTKMGSYDAG